MMPDLKKEQIARLISQSPDLQLNQRVSLKNVEVKLKNELNKYEKKFEFPPNPAFHLKS